MRSITISLTVSPGLLAQVDELAKQERETRSWVIRRAMRKYVEEAGIGEPVRVHADAGRSVMKILPPKPPRDFTEVMKKYPRTNPMDTKLLEFLDDYENDRL